MQTVKKRINQKFETNMNLHKSIESYYMKSKFISSNQKSSINCYNKQIEKPFCSFNGRREDPCWSITLHRTCFFLSGFQFRRSFFIRSCRNKKIRIIIQELSIFASLHVCSEIQRYLRSVGRDNRGTCIAAFFFFSSLLNEI